MRPPPPPPDKRRRHSHIITKTLLSLFNTLLSDVAHISHIHVTHNPKTAVVYTSAACKRSTQAYGLATGVARQACVHQRSTGYRGASAGEGLALAFSVDRGRPLTRGNRAFGDVRCMRENSTCERETAKRQIYVESRRPWCPRYCCCASRTSSRLCRMR